MVKVVLLLCVVAAALVYAKPSTKQQEPVVATFSELKHGRPERPEGSCAAVEGSLILATGTNCNAAKRRFACDGSCFDVDQVYHTFEVTGFSAPCHANIDFFDVSSCAKDFVSSTANTVDKCYKSNGTEIEKAKSFSCYVTDE